MTGIRMRLATRLFAAGLALASLGACSLSGVTPPPRLYVLNPVAPQPVGERSPAGLVRIVVAQVQVPDYLDRPQLVEHASPNELKLVNSDQWAERLSLNIARVVAQNLAAMVPADAIVTVPVRAALPYDFEVILVLNEFELDQNSAAVLGGRWSVTNADGTKELAAADVSLALPVGQPGIPGAVEAMNRNLGKVCSDIAEAIKRLRAEGEK